MNVFDLHGLAYISDDFGGDYFRVSWALQLLQNNGKFISAQPGDGIGGAD